MTFNTLRYDGFYWHFGRTAGGLIVVAGRWVLSYPLYGAKRELFERWRERDLRIPLDRVWRLNLRDSRGMAAFESEAKYRTVDWKKED